MQEINWKQYLRVELRECFKTMAEDEAVGGYY